MGWRGVEAPVVGRGFGKLCELGGSCWHAPIESLEMAGKWQGTFWNAHCVEFVTHRDVFYRMTPCVLFFFRGFEKCKVRAQGGLAGDSTQLNWRMGVQEKLVGQLGAGAGAGTGRGRSFRGLVFSSRSFLRIIWPHRCLGQP